jgi:thiamine biosynthesis lipoprotein
VSTATAAPTARSVAQVMGLPFSLALRGRHAGTDAGRAAWAEAVTELRWLDRVFSTWRPDSAVSRIDRGELAVEDAPPVVAEVLALGEEARVVSDGAFSVWRAGPDGRVRLDPSGVVKGWAAERVARHLSALPGTGFALNAGGDVVCRSRPGDPAWRIGVEDPHDPGALVATLEVHDGAVATSGTAHRGAHLVDARTGRPPQGVASVTVVGPSLTWADIDATAAFAHGAEALAWLGRRLEGSGRHGLVVLPGGGTHVVTGAVR